MQVADHGGDAGAAHGHQHLLQLEQARTAISLPPEDQKLLLDGDGVQGPVFLSLRVDAAHVSALGLRNLRGVDGSPPGSPVPGILQARTLEHLQLFSLF